MAIEPKKDDMGTANLIILGVFLGFCCLMWYENHADISYSILKFFWNLLDFLDFSFTPHYLKELKLSLAHSAYKANSLSFLDLLTLVNKVGYLFIWIPILFAIKGIKNANFKQSRIPKRKITAHTLPWIMSNHCPAVIPSLYYGDKETLLLNVDPPQHRRALNPEEWVKKYGLVINKCLDHDKCKKIFRRDLGKSLESIDNLNNVEKIMFAIFAPRVFGTSKNYSETQKLLDDLNKSCHKGSYKGEKGYPIFEIADSQFKKYKADKNITKWLKKYKYSRTLLYAMHKQAMTCGKLPSSHFRWLKGIDRGLWYALNTTGRKTPFIESTGVFCQHMWEEYASEVGYELKEVQLDEAIRGLEQYLEKQGIINSSETNKSE